MEVQGPLTWEIIRDILRSANLKIIEDELSEAEQEREWGGTLRGNHSQGKLFDISKMPYDKLVWSFTQRIWENGLSNDTISMQRSESDHVRSGNEHLQHATPHNKPFLALERSEYKKKTVIIRA